MSKLTGNLIATISIICLGSLQFGYHMAELNSPEGVLTCSKQTHGIPYQQSFFGRHGYKQCIPLESDQFGMVTSIFSIGGLLGSFYVGKVADMYGRRKTSLIHGVFYILGGAINATANSYAQLIVGRFICGLGAGCALVVTALLINELAPTSSKGLLGSMNQVSINIGILFTQILSLRWATSNDWRWLLAMGGILGFVNLLLVVFYLDESPMWLVANNRSDEAFTILHKLRGGQYNDLRQEVSSWKAPSVNDRLLETGEGNESDNSTVTLTDYLTDAQYRPSLIVSTGILSFQQFDGVNSIIFYGVNILIGIFPDHAISINCLISTVNVVVTFLSAQYVDKLGRKPLLLTSVTFLGIATAVMAIGIINTNAILSIVGTFTYITFFAVGLGPIPFLLVGEVTQPRAKASAQSWGTAMNWVATFIVGYLFPILKNKLGGYVYFIFLIMCGLSFVFIKTNIPESKGKASYQEVWQVSNEITDE